MTSKLARLGGAAVLAFLLADLLASSTAFERLPAWEPPWLAWSPASGWPTLAFVVLLALAAFPALAPDRVLAPWCGLTAATLALALYGWSNVDWTLVMADVGLATGGIPRPDTVVAAVAPFAWAVAFHGFDEKARAKAVGAAKGIPPEEAAAALALHRPAAWRLALGATALWAVVVLAFYALLAARPLLRPLAEAAPAAVPVLVAALLAVALLYATRQAQRRD